LDYSAILTAGGFVVAGIVWLVRLEGRINVLGSRADSTEKRVDGLEERIIQQLDRIESRLFQLTTKE